MIPSETSFEGNSKTTCRGGDCWGLGPFPKEIEAVGQSWYQSSTEHYKSYTGQISTG